MGYGSFYAGLTGLKAHASALSVIGNNLANVNTIGYKGSRATFAELFSGGGGYGVAGSGEPYQIGMGTKLSTVQQLFHQGALQPTEVTTDLALEGNGFFVLRQPDGLNVYTRAGNFSFDDEGYLVNPTGYKVQGYTSRDDEGHIVPSGAVSDIQIPAGMTAPPQATRYFRLDMNLNAGARVDDPATSSVNEAEIFTTSVSVYDALGEAHDLTIVFTPVDNDGDGVLDQWNWEARVPRADVDVTTNPGDPEYYVVDSGTVTFDGNGRLTAPADNVTLSIPAWSNGAAAQDVEWRLYDEDAAPVVSGYSAPSAIDSLYQDGFSMGRLRAIAIDENGLISGVFTNGRVVELARLAIASFNNPGGLFKHGDNTFLASLGSGPAAMGVADTGGRGKVMSRALELSNVDITEQFTDMIVVERGYQSNSRVITTTDQMVQEALTLKR